MTELEEAKREIEALRERISRLCAAVGHVSASLDLDTVLHEVLDSARALTGARHGVIATVDEQGAPGDFRSSGISAGEHRLLEEWPDGPRLFEHFRALPGPIRLADVRAHVRALGFSADRLPWTTFLGAPMRHRGVHVGSFFLAAKEGAEEFTGGDEEVLELLASQAASAIANARTHRAERRARAGLEALIETSPVGVVVFDAPSGAPVSLNREAKRLVEGLRLAGRTPEDLLDVLTCRFADGREIALGELPMAQVLGGAETMRAEEVVLSVPDGRSVTTLVNVTPIRSPGGTVDSVVVTLQDLAPLQNLERMRAEFLGLVSHELRAPLTSIKGSTAAVLGVVRDFGAVEMREFIRIIDGQADHMIGLVSDLLDAGRIDAGTLSVEPEPTEVAALVERARGTFLSGGGRHTVLVDLPPELPRAMADRQRIAQVLNNLLSNAARHSPETSSIRVSAVREGVHVAVSVADRGKGIAPEELPRLFRKYTGQGGGERAGGRAGSGLGLVICKGLVEAHGGRIRAESAGAGRGTTFTFTLPVAGGAADDAPDAARSRPRPPSEESKPTPILAVDDDPETLRHLRDTLTAAGYAPVVTAEHEELSRIIETEKPRLVLLDLLLPGTDGIELMASVPGLADLPVIFISAYGRDETIARALEAGAEDYIVKPFSPTELTARIQAALRRRAEPDPFVLGELAIDYDARRVSVAGRAVELTAMEYELLRVLSLNAGRVTAYETLMRQVWGGRQNGGSARLRTTVKKLRRKLGEDAAEPRWIFAERAVGYRMPRPPARQQRSGPAPSRIPPRP